MRRIYQFRHPYYNGLFGASGSDITVYLKTNAGSTISISIDPSDSVYYLKTLVESKLNIPVFQQKLIYLGRRLLDDKTLLDYNIKDGSTIYIF